MAHFEVVARTAPAPPVIPRPYTKEFLIAELRLWTEYHDGRPPTIAEWNRGAARRGGAPFEAGWPSTQPIVTHFGSWNRGLVAAGLSTRPVRAERSLTRDELHALYHDAGLSTRAIATRQGVSHTTVKRWLRRHGIGPRSADRGLRNRGITPPTRDELQRLIHDEHLSYPEVAARYGVHPTAIPHWLDKHEIAKPGIWDSRWKGERPALPDEKTLRALYERGLSVEAIGRRYGASYALVAVVMAEHGIALRKRGWHPERDLIGADGHDVRSTYELFVCNWLTAHGIAHEYEPRLPCDRRYAADFLANDWYIEVWGVRDSDNYRRRREYKRALYWEHSMPLIEISYSDFSTQRAHRLPDLLSRCLTPPQSNVCDMSA